MSNSTSYLQKVQNPQAIEEKLEEVKVRQYESELGIRKHFDKDKIDGPVPQRRVNQIQKQSLAKMFYELCDNPKQREELLSLTDRM